MRKLRSQVFKLQRTMNATVGTHKRKTIRQSRTTCNIGSPAYHQSSFGRSNVEGDLGALRFFDVNNPATPLTIAGGNGTYTRRFLFESIYHKLSARNNYCVPVVVDMYVWGVKHETANSPDTLMLAGIADQVQ